MIYCIEGPDGVGKTAVVENIKAKLTTETNWGNEYLFSRFPGAHQSQICSKLREEMFKDSVSNMAQYHMIWADFYQAFDEVIIPKMKKNITIIMERSWISTYIYQGLIKGINTNFIINDIQRFFECYSKEIFPITIISLEAIPDQIRERILLRESEKGLKGFDKWAFENTEEIVYYYEEAFVSICNIFENIINVVNIDASGSIDVVADKIIKLIRKEK